MNLNGSVKIKAATETRLQSSMDFVLLTFSIRLYLLVFSEINTQNKTTVTQQLPLVNCSVERPNGKEGSVPSGTFQIKRPFCHFYISLFPSIDLGDII